MKKQLPKKYFFTLVCFILSVNIYLPSSAFSQSKSYDSKSSHSHSDEPLIPKNLVGLSKDEVEHFILDHFDYPDILDDLKITEEYQNNKAMQNFVFPVILKFYNQIYDGVASGTLTHSDQVFNKYNLTISSLKNQLAGQVFPENETFTPKVLNGPCINMNFEDGDLNGWTLIEGKVDGSVPYSFVNGTVVATPGASHQIVTAGNDPVVNVIPRVNPDGGSFSCRLGDGTATQNGAAKMRQTFLVTPTNSILTYSYAVVFQDPGHQLRQQPYFSVRVYDENGGTIECGTYNVISGTNAEASGFSKQGTNILYKNWTTVFSPLNAYIGQNVTVEFTTGDCSQTGHYGYAYIDAACNTFDITTSTGDTVLCENDNITLFAPEGGDTYLWSNGETTSSINVNQPGVYNVDIVPFQGSLCTISIEVEIIGIPLPTANFTTEDVCLNEPTLFQDLSSMIAPDTINSWYWDFGDGNTSTDQNPTHTFLTHGTHNVTLSVM